MKFALALVMLIWTAGTALADPARLRLGYADIEVFPHQLGASTDVPADPGIAVELLQKGFAQAEIGLDLVRLPNRRVLDSLKTGEIDGAFLFSYNEERNRFAEYPRKNGEIDASRRLARQTYVLYKRADNPLGFDGELVANLHSEIAANAGFSIADDLRHRGIPVLEVETTPLAFGMLLAGHVDGYAVMDTTGDPYLRMAGIGNVVKLPTPLSSKDYFLVFSRASGTANPALAERIWDQLARTRAAEEPALERKYLGLPPS